MNKSDISNLVKNYELNTRLAALAPKAESKAEQDKIAKLQTHNLNYFLGKKFSTDDGSQNMYESTLYTLELRKDKGTDYVLT